MALPHHTAAPKLRYGNFTAYEGLGGLSRSGKTYWDLLGIIKVL